MRYTTRIIVPPRPRRSGLPGSPGTGSRPQAIGVRKSLGFGDAFGLAAAGQITAAAAHPDFAPFFAQHPMREPAYLHRTPADTLSVASRAVGNARYRQPWGADADLLRTPLEVEEAAAAGYTYFTVDLSEHVRGHADQLSAEGLAQAVQDLIGNGELPEDWASPYLDRAVDLPGVGRLSLAIDPLRRAAVKFGAAIAHGARMYETISRANRGRPWELEISLDQMPSPVSTTEHIFIGLELESRGVRATGLALRINDRSPGAFELALREHVALAGFCGPYKLTFRSGMYEARLTPVIGRCCGDSLHFKTCAESEIEALRLACRMDPELFGRLMAAGGFVIDPGAGDLEARYVDSEVGRDAAFRATTADGGGLLRDALIDLLVQHAEIYQELLINRYGRLIESLNAG